MLIHVSDQVLAGLKALGRECPEEGTSAYFVELNKIIVNKTLVHVFDCLKDHASLGTDFLDFFEVEDLFLFIVDAEDALALFFK